MGKLFKFIFRFIILIIVLVVGVLGFIYYLISDATNDTPVDLYDNAITLDGELGNIIDEALESNEEFALSVDENQLNKIIFALIRKYHNENYMYADDGNENSSIYTYTIDPSISTIGGSKVTIRSIYANINENSLTVYAPMDIMGIKSRLYAGFTLSENNGVYEFTLNKLGLGKINLMSGLGKNILNEVIKATGFSESFINEKLQAYPVTFRMDDFTFIIDKEDLGDYLINQADEANVNEIISILTSKENDMLDIRFFSSNDVNKFGIVLNAKAIEYNPITDGEPLYQLNFNDLNSKLTTLINNSNQQTIIEENFKIVSKYLIHGYSKLTPEEKAIIDTIDFASINIDDKASYNGLIVSGSGDLKQHVEEGIYQEMSNLSDGEITVDINDVFLNNIIQNSNTFLGYGYNFIYEKNNQKEIFTSGIEAVWIDIIDGQIGFKLLYNLNSKRICLFASLNDESTNKAKIEAVFDDIRIGTVELSDDFKATILSYLNSSLSATDLSIIQIIDNKIVIDSNAFINELKGNNPLGDLLGIIQDNEMISINLTGASLADNGKISFTIDLEKMESTNDFSSEIIETQQGFDVKNFIANKTQTMIISGLSSIDQKIVFTNKDFNKLLYQETNSYNGFENSTLLPDNLTNFNIKVKAILFEFTPNTVIMNFILDINSLETVIILKSNVSYNNDQTTVYLTLSESTNIGSLELMSNDFILNILGNNINNFSLMNYDSNLKRFTIDSTIFQQFMNIGGTSTPLTVTKLNITENGFEVYVDYTDPTLSSAVNLAIQAVESALQNDFLNVSGFDTADSEQQEAVANLESSLNSLSQIIQDPETVLSEDDTNSLINAINQLSEENQQTFFTQLENQASSSELTSLYDLLFGN